ncbi:unnamed protein product, partial [marine sediment metagenome]
MFLSFVKWVGVVVSLVAIGQWIFGDVSESLGRVYGSMGNPNFLAQMLIFPLFAAFYDRNLWRKVAIMAVIGVAIYLTGSRAVMLGVGLAFYLWFMFFGKVKWFYKGLLTLGLVILGGFLVFGMDTRSFYSRMFLWGSVGDILSLRDLVFGTGIETFYSRYVAVMPAEVFEYEQFFSTPSSIHNEFLEAVVERGIFGALLYLFMIVYLLWSLFVRKVKWRWVGLGILAYVIAVQFSFSTVVHYVFLGAFWAVYLFDGRGKVFKVNRVLLLAISGLILFSSVCLMISDFMLKRG